MKQYTVCGQRRVRGHAPGSTFEEEIPDAQEQRLIATGNLALADGTGDPLLDHTRDELNALAVQAGVEDPHDLPNKAAVADAIKAANEPDASGSDEKEE